MGWTWRYTFPPELLAEPRRGKVCHDHTAHAWDDDKARRATCTECGAVRERVRV